MSVDPESTYQPDAQQCGNGHPFNSEADCVLPDGWDQFMCKRCLTDAGRIPPDGWF